MAKHKLTMHINEDHDEMLEPIHSSIGSKRLAFSGNTMLHFDSHPDLLIPSELSADDAFDKNEVYRTTSIGTWIMPLMYAGHITTVVWIKKEWATQIADGLYKFVVGKDSATGYIRCSCTEPYFVSELSYAPADQLSNTKDVVLIVATYKSVEESLKSIASQIDSLGEEKDIILDIDFDYFSTTDPLTEMYSSKQLDRFFSLYRFVEKATPEESTVMRAQQLEYLDTTMKSVANRSNGNKDSGDSQLQAVDDSRLATIKSLIDEEVVLKGSVDADQLHSHGCTFDISGLPHHISAVPEIERYIADMVELLSKLKIKPKIITSSRSADDDYCPKGQVDIIEEKVINALRTLYKDLTVKKHYLDIS